MKLKISQDAEAGADTVYAGLMDMPRYEAALHDRGIELKRRGGWGVPEIGAGWTGRADIRGKIRQIEAEITAMEPGRGVSVAARIGGLRMEHVVTLVPLGQAVTRVNLVTDLRPDTLTARLLVQSLKLARARVLDGMQARLNTELRRIERLPAGRPA